jgi:hypothetical protein
VKNVATSEGVDALTTKEVPSSVSSGTISSSHSETGGKVTYHQI